MNQTGDSFPQRRDPSGTIAEQYASNQILVGEKYSAESSKRNMKDKIQDIKNCVKELDREMDVVMDLMEKMEKKIQMLETHYRKLTTVNQQLNTELKKMPSKISQYQAYKANSPSTVQLQNSSSQNGPERVIACHFSASQERRNEGLQRSSELHKNKHVVISLSGIKKMPVDEQEEDQTFPALLKGDNLEEDSVICSEPSKFLHDVWDLVKCSLAFVLGFGLCTYLILFCEYYLNHNFISNIIILIFCERDIAHGLTQLWSPYFTWRNDGLQPF